MSMQLGKFHFDAPVFLAPMAGVTDVSYRIIAQRLGLPSVTAVGVPGGSGVIVVETSPTASIQRAASTAAAGSSAAAVAKAGTAAAAGVVAVGADGCAAGAGDCLVAAGDCLVAAGAADSERHGSAKGRK